MPVEIVKTTKRKRHPKTPADLQELSDVYGKCGALLKRTDVKASDVVALIERYGKDPEVDLYTLSDVLHISRRQLYEILNDEEFRDLMKAAKLRRSELLGLRGLEVAADPYHRAIDGKECNKELILAARNYANYCLQYAQTLANDFGSKNSDKEGNVNIQINIPHISNIGE